MTFMRVYLVVYFLLLAGAVGSLWQADILTHVPVAWLVLALGLAVALGALLALTSVRRPAKPDLAP